MWSNLLLAIPTIYEIVTDRAEWKKDIRDKKGQDVIIRTLMMVLVAILNCLFVDPGVTFWQSFVLSVGIFVMFFDYSMGVILARNPFFLGTTSQTDSIWRFIPWYCGLLVRGMVFAISIILYEHLELVNLFFKLII